MESLPLFHRLGGQPVLVLGTGDAADAKARLVREAGGTVVHEAGSGVRLAFVALAEGAEEVAGALRAEGLLVNVVDRPELCDFTVPAIVDRSPVLLAVGTGGASASLAKALKERLEILLPGGLGRLAAAIRDARAKVAAAHPSIAARRRFWAQLLAAGGPLDPLLDHADPAQAIASPEGEADKATEITEILLCWSAGQPASADQLTLAQLRLLAGADLVVHDPATPADVLAFIRRDSARLAADSVPDGARGQIIVVKLVTTEEQKGH